MSHTVYRLTSSTGVLYVGRTVDWPARSRWHRSQSTWAARWTATETVGTPSLEVAQYLEANQIARWKPEGNAARPKVPALSSIPGDKMVVSL